MCVKEKAITIYGGLVLCGNAMDRGKSENKRGEFALTIEILLNGVSLSQIRATTPNPDKPEKRLDAGSWILDTG